MGENGRGRQAVEHSTGIIDVNHDAATCTVCFAPEKQEHAWWEARPDSSRLVGLVVARDDMPSVTEQRNLLSRFGVPIAGFRHPAAETLESWRERLHRFFDTLSRGDVLVVANVHALGRDLAEETAAVAELSRRGIVVKVLSHGSGHLHSAGR
jgi:hypothetical protein